MTTRVGHFLADNTEERLQVAERAGSLYQTRNRIVHGNVGHTREAYTQMSSIAADGTDLARDTLWKLLDQGAYPDWDRLMMS